MQKILLLHGALGSPIDLQPLARELAKSGFAPLVPEFIGHGSTKADQPVTLKSLAEQISSYVSVQGLHDVPVFGYSLGGFIALQLAADRVLKGPIMTLATKLNWNDDTAKKEAANCNPERLLAKVPAYYQQLIQQHNYLPELLLQTAELLFKMPLVSLPPAELLEVPVLLLRGENDKLVTQSETQAYRDSLKIGQMGVIPTAGHSLATWDTQLLSILIQNFIRSNARSKDDSHPA